MRSHMLTILFMLHGAAVWSQTPKSCADLTAFSIPGMDLKFEKAELVPEAPAAAILSPPGVPGFTGTMQAYCRARGILDPHVGSDGTPYGIGFEIALPAKWNGRFLFQGGGGLNGTIQAPLGATASGGLPGLARGFAVVSTDSGHKGKGAFDASFFKDQQASLDFAFRAVGRVAEAAKGIIAQYYQRAPEHSYFVGCSTGGREGMVATQRYPTYFDGVVSGAPAMRTGYSNLADRWVAVTFNKIAPKDGDGKPIPGGAFSESDRKLVVASLLKKCDAMDGLQDGMIFDMLGCDFDPEALTCSGQKSDACLTPLQTVALKRAFGGPRDSRGIQVYPGFLFDTGITARSGIPGLLSSGVSPLGPPNTSTQQDVDAEALTAADPLIDTVYTNLSTYSGRGGKLIFYHGVSDPWFSALDTLEYFKKMADASGGMDKAREFSRLYLVPGMGHCGGGEAALDTFDLLDAVVRWVEKGESPESVIMTGRAFPGRSRTLCPYPRHAHYKGQGDPEKAENFECRE